MDEKNSYISRICIYCDKCADIGICVLLTGLE